MPWWNIQTFLQYRTFCQWNLCRPVIGDLVCKSLQISCRKSNRNLDLLIFVRFSLLSCHRHDIYSECAMPWYLLWVWYFYLQVNTTRLSQTSPSQPGFMSWFTPRNETRIRPENSQRITIRDWQYQWQFWWWWRIEMFSITEELNMTLVGSPLRDAPGCVVCSILMQ